MKKEDLFLIADEARANSYSPYSNISVGAALLTKSGKIYTGANIESASYTPTVCAERVAFFKAISDGEREFSAIAISGGKSERPSEDAFYPCGVCLQVMSEFCFDDFEIIVKEKTGAVSYKFSEIFPKRFSL